MKKITKMCLVIVLSILVSYNLIFSSTSASSNVSSENSNNDSYIKNSIIPKSLYVISEDNMTNEEKTIIATLQGIVGTKSDNQIYIISSGEPDYNVWLKDLNKNYNVKCISIKNPWKLLNKFK